MPLKDCRVLVAEDETLIAMFLETYLSSVGASVATIGRTEDGMTLDHATYDVALLDVSLADGEVFPLADCLQAHGVRLVFHTGHGKDLDKLRCYENALALEKPADRTEILSAVLMQAGRRGEFEGRPC